MFLFICQVFIIDYTVNYLSECVIAKLLTSLNEYIEQSVEVATISKQILQLLYQQSPVGHYFFGKEIVPSEISMIVQTLEMKNSSTVISPAILLMGKEFSL